MQRTFTGLKIAGLLVLIGAGLGSTHTAAPAATPPSAMHFGVAMAACLMAYNGWSYVSFVAGEVRDPQKNLLRSLVLGMAAVAAAVCIGQHRLPEGDDDRPDRGHRPRGRRSGYAHDGPDRRELCVADRAAFDHRRGERLHSDRRAHPVCAGSRPAVLRAASAKCIRDFRLPALPSYAAESGRRSWCSPGRTRRSIRTRFWRRGSSIR